MCDSLCLRHLSGLSTNDLFLFWFLTFDNCDAPSLYCRLSISLLQILSVRTGSYLICMCLPYASKKLPSSEDRTFASWLHTTLSTHLNFESRISKLHPHILRSRKNYNGKQSLSISFTLASIRITRSNGLLSVNVTFDAEWLCWPSFHLELCIPLLTLLPTIGSPFWFFVEYFCCM